MLVGGDVMWVGLN